MEGHPQVWEPHWPWSPCLSAGRMTRTAARLRLSVAGASVEQCPWLLLENPLEVAPWTPTTESAIHYMFESVTQLVKEYPAFV